MRHLSSILLMACCMTMMCLSAAHAQTNPFEQFLRHSLHIAGPYDVTQDDLTDNGQRYLLVLPKKEKPCNAQGCPLYIMTYQKPKGWEVVTTLHEVVAPVMVSTVVNDGWHDLILANPKGGFKLFIHNGQGYAFKGPITLPR